MNGEGRVTIIGRNKVYKKREIKKIHTKKTNKADKGRMEGKEQVEVFLQFFS